MDKSQETKNNNNSLVKKKTLTRFGRICDDPVDILTKILKKKISLYELCQKCIEGTISPKFRIIAYNIFLGILPLDQLESWQAYLENGRKKYEEFLQREVNNNPNIIPFINCTELKGSEKYEKFIPLVGDDFDLLSLIKLDVDRTFQDLDLFRNQKVKEMLCKILFIYSKNNNDPSYCQGMNEILGTLLYALLPSLKVKGTSETIQNDISTKSKSKEEELYNEFTSDEYFEAGLYNIYEEVMSRDLKELYTYNDDRFRGKSHTFDKNNLTLEQLNEFDESPLAKRIKKIFYVDLKARDKELFEYLVVQIEPDVFLFRWILCMLNRELTLKNVIWVWDCIFAYEFIEFTINTVEVDKTRFNFLDYLCVSMIEDLRPNFVALQGGGSGMLLMSFLQYPNEINIKEIIERAVLVGTDLSGSGNLWEDSKLK